MEAVPELNPDGEWFVHERPFRHVRAERVFRDDCYRGLEKAFGAIRKGGETGGIATRFERSTSAYDALIAAVSPLVSARFHPLFDRRWIALLARVLDLPVLPQIDGALHEVPINSRAGWIHNDFCSAWFDAGVHGDLIFPDRRKCAYFTGSAKTPDARPREYIRAATMIFYLDNDDWKPGAGGETGLYATSRRDTEEVHAVAPVSNSLLLFECSPHSYHALLANPGCSRKSIILWLHCTVDYAQSRWGRAVTRRRST
jgi:hypothetical protein